MIETEPGDALPADRSPGSWGWRLLAGVLVLVLLALWLVPQVRRNAAAQDHVPILATGAELPPDLRAEREAELAVEMEGLQAVQARLAALEARPSLQAAVTRSQIQEAVRRLDELEKAARDPHADPASLRQTFEEIDDLWQERTLALQNFLDHYGEVESYVVLPPFRMDLYRELAGTPEAERYRALAMSLRDRVARLQERLRKEGEADLQGRAERLRRQVSLRYEVLRRWKEGLLLLEAPDRCLEDAYLEVSSYPDRRWGLFLLEWAEIRHRSGSEVSVALNQVQEVGLVVLALVLVGLPAAAAARADRGALPAVRAGAWFGTWVAAVMAEAFLGSTIGEALRPLTSLVGLYALFRIYMVWVDTGLGPMLERILDENWPDRPEQGRRPLRSLGLVFLGQAVLLRLVLAVAGPGVLFLGAERLLGFAVPLALWIGSWAWRSQLAVLLPVVVPRPVGSALGEATRDSRWAWLTAPLGLALVLAFGAVLGLLAQASRSAWSKRLSAGLLRHWLETASRHEPVDLPPPPPGYREAFLAVDVDPAPHWEESEPGFLPSLLRPVEDWAADQEGEPVLTIHGPAGSGREDAVAHVARHFAARFPVAEVRPAGRVTTAAEFVRLAAEALVGPAAPPGGQAWTVESLARALQGRPRTLVVVPDAGRLFLGTVGGFEAYRALQVLIRRCQLNLYWVLAMGTPTLAYLREVSAGDVFLLRAVPMPRWSDDSLRKMVLRRHEATGLAYRFGEGVVQAARATPGATPEGQYFQILWEKCAGNPAVAQDLWLASAGLEEGGVLRLRMPPRNPPGLLPGLPNVVHFVLASVTRHGSLTLGEIVQATSLSERQVYLACERCLEEGVLDPLPDGRMAVARLWLVDVSRFLEGRNLLDAD